MDPLRLISRVMILLHGAFVFIYLKILARNRFSSLGFPKGIELGANIKLRNKNSKLSIGKHLYLRKQSDVECLGGLLEIGNDVFINKNCNFICREGISIGNDCMFGENVSIYDHNHKINVIPFGKRSFSTAPIEIGNNVWVGCNVFIGKGVSIGNNVVIGAHQKVNRDIESNSIYSDGGRKELIVDTKPDS